MSAVRSAGPQRCGPHVGQHVLAKRPLKVLTVHLAQERLRPFGPLLGQQHLEAGRIHPGRVESAGTQGGHHAVDDQRRGGGEQQDVVSGAQRLDFTRARRDGFGHARHGEGIREDQPLESEGVEQPVADDQGRQGGGQSRHAIERRHLQMRRHDAFHTPIDQTAERRHLHSGEREAVGQDARQGQMGVEVGITVAWEMLGAGHDPSGPKSLRPSQSAFAHGPGWNRKTGCR